MSAKIFRVFVVVVLLSLPTSGQNSQQHLICKNVENVFSDGQDDSTVSHQRRIQVRQGKRGPAGVKGERGLPGVQGIPGSRAVVDYERIFQVIEEKHREAMREIESRFEELQKNFTQQDAEPTQTSEQTTNVGTEDGKNQSCRAEHGVFYFGKCYFTPYLSLSRSLDYNRAVQKCNNRGAMVAELLSQSHQRILGDFIRTRIEMGGSWIYLWMGMTYHTSERNLRFRSGNEVSVDQFRWLSGYPSGSKVNTAIAIRNGQQEIFNWNPRTGENGVICEKAL